MPTMHDMFASAPFVVGKSVPSAAEPDRTAEEALCPVVAHDWVNSEYKPLVGQASPKALAVKPGQFFNLLCPSPDVGELWLRRPQSVYRIDRGEGRVEFLYKCVGRGTRGLATPKVGVGLPPVAPISQLAGDNGVAVTAILSARSPEFVMADDLFGQVGEVVSVLD